ncbi:hypothetical protein QFC21_000016 [Naganishia friedmannii]|uniref:Uncharacterized protein n=1 Tax=Naganishia friedmannii TaxID=89922 RepID=A0ACC2WBB6_9TREE|nr:hypothetical protein QFC21_000016 [Naganishia friedmannii]
MRDLPSHTGIVIGTPIQAAFYTAAGNDIANWRGSQYGFYFVIGCIALAMVLVLICLPARKPNSEEPPDVLVEATEREASASLVQEKGVEV